MSTPNGPARRRRIAGEANPAAPAKKTPAKKAAAKKAPAKKTPATKAAAKKAPAKKTPANDVAPATPDTTRVSIPRPGAPRVAKPVAQTPVVSPGEQTPSREAREKTPRAPLNVRLVVPLAVIALAALVFGAVFGLKGYTDWHDQRQVRSAAEQAAARAGTASETIFSFSYTALPQHVKDSKVFMTAKFKKEFDTISPALTQLAPQRKIRVKAITRNAAPMECGSSCSPDRARVLIFLDQARTQGSGEPTVFGNRIVVSMVKQHGTWLVNNITAL